jgi:hypothetical protein
MVRRRRKRRRARSRHEDPHSGKQAKLARRVEQRLPRGHGGLRGGGGRRRHRERKEGRMRVVRDLVSTGPRQRR